MRFRQITIIIFILGFLLCALTSSTSVAGNYEKKYSFQNQYGLFGQKLYISIQPSTYVHYSNMNHTVYSDSDFQQFITPNAVKPIADEIRKATNDLPNNDEQFADAVLTFVHQIHYLVTGLEYPVETLVNNSGDCVGSSLLAASIMKAGGLDVVLIRYEGIDPGHINVGVCLPYTPIYHNLLMIPTSFAYNNKTYWTAEATPEIDWKVGDQSSMLANTKAIIIPLDSSEPSTPGQVSASLGTPLQSSHLTVNLSPEPSNLLNETRGFNISGSSFPAFSGQNITIYISQNKTFDYYFETIPDSNGIYSFLWNFTSPGTYYITTSSKGNSTYSGSDSETLTIFVGPESFTQFQTPEYNYILAETDVSYYLMGVTGAVDYAIRPFQGVNSFLSIPLDTNISFSYNFRILQTGHSASNVSGQTITLPSYHEKIYSGRSHMAQIVEVPEQTYTVPSEVPQGMGPMTLPSDINQTINNQFCFLIQNDGYDNYSLNMKALNSYDLSNITKDAANTNLINISDNLNEDTWYTVVESILDNQVTAQVKDSNGTVIENIAPSSNCNNTVLLVANNVDNAVIMKNFDMQLINKQTETKATNNDKSFSPSIILAVGLIASFLAALVYSRKKVIQAK